MTSNLNKSFAAAFLALSAAFVLPAQAHGVQADNAADLALAKQVQATLLQAAPFQDQGVDLQVKVAAGQVQLTGWVSFASDDLLARQKVLHVPGVQSVSSNFHTWSSDTRD